MTAIGKVISSLEKKAHPSLQENYDNSGLICGDVSLEVSGILVSLDCTEAVVEEAIEKNCNLIVSHHPILFKSLKSLTGKDYVERTLIKAIKNDIAIYAIHTNLDSVSSGVNAAIADKLNLEERKILRPKEGLLRKLVTFCPVDHAETLRRALFDAGAGHIGNYDHCSFNAEGQGTFRGGEGSDPFVGQAGDDHSEDEIRIETVYRSFDEGKIIQALLEAHPYEEVAYDLYPLLNKDVQSGMGLIGKLPEAMDLNSFLELLKERFETGVIRHTDDIGRKISTVALCGGSGAFLIGDAIRAKADVFVTGDIKYHDFFDADGKIVLADIGHYESERFTIDLLVKLLSENFTTFATHFSSVSTNPINYF